MPDTDFQKIINDLHEARYSDAHLAELCGCTRQYIRGLRIGKNKSPRYAIGQKLVSLHEALQ